MVTTKSLDQFDVTDAATDIVVQQYLSGMHGYHCYFAIIHTVDL